MYPEGYRLGLVPMQKSNQQSQEPTFKDEQGGVYTTSSLWLVHAKLGTWFQPLQDRHQTPGGVTLARSAILSPPTSCGNAGLPTWMAALQ